LVGPDLGAGLLRDACIPTAPSVTYATAAEAVAAADRLGYPVVAKAVHPSLLHKSDVGGVRLGLADGAAVRDAAEDLLRLVAGARVLVQPQMTGIEVVVGGLRDPHFGPAVMVGLGGILVEVLGDVAFGLAPLSPDDARRLIAGLRGHAALTGARGAEAVDLDALAAVVCAAGDLLCARPEIAELDLNPLLASARGCVAVDWRVLVANPPSRDEAGRAGSPCQSAET
jgi:acetyltransferase